MSPARFEDRIGVLERLTSSTAFAVLLGCAALVLTLVLALGVFYLPFAITMLVSGDPQAWVIGLSLAAGAVGAVGLLRAHQPATSRSDLRATLFCLGVGIANALVIVGSLIAFEPRSADSWLCTVALLVLTVMILAALGRAARVRRLFAAAEGRVLDDFPLLFLTLALAQLACAIAIGTNFAFGS